MHPQVNSGIAVQSSPKERGQGEYALLKEKQDKDRKSKAIGCVSRYKAIPTTPVIVHGIYKILEVGMVRRTKPLKQRLEKRRGDLVARHEHQDKK